MVYSNLQMRLVSRSIQIKYWSIFRCGFVVSHDANFPRLLGTLSYRLTPSFLVGIQYRFDHFDIPRTDSLLTANNPVGVGKFARYFGFV